MEKSLVCGSALDRAPRLGVKRETTHDAIQELFQDSTGWDFAIMGALLQACSEPPMSNHLWVEANGSCPFCFLLGTAFYPEISGAALIGVILDQFCMTSIYFW